MIVVLMYTSEACCLSELFLCKQQGKRWTFIALCAFGDTLVLCILVALASGEIKPLSKCNMDFVSQRE